MTIQHGEISSEEAIPDLCKSVFFSKERLYSLAWAVVVIFVVGYGTAVAYALTTSVAVTKLEAEVAENKNAIENLNTQILKKLDIIIEGQGK